MGGRGASSSISNSSLDMFRKSKTRILSLEGTDIRAVNEALSGTIEVLKDFGIGLDAVRAIEAIDYNSHLKRATMSVNGFSDLGISRSKFKDYKEAVRRAKENKGYVIGDSLHAIGSHEAGHLIINHIINKNMKFDNLLDKAKYRQSQKLEKSIIKEASKKYGRNPTISKYGSTSPAEKVAEAVSDVYSNKSKANPYSKVIVSVLKEKYKSM